MDKLGRFIPQAFGNCYRFSQKNWNRLSRNQFYSPVSLILPTFPRGEKKGGNSFDGSKLLLIHATDDSSVPYSYTKRLAAKTGAQLITLRSGGHFGFSKSLDPRIYRHIRRFIE